MAREYIKAFGGKLLGYVEEDSTGNKVVHDASGAIVSKYTKSNNTTYDFYGRIIATGDVASGFLLLKNN